MLAKLWKKILLAICIIACIFNIMSKLVNRHSLRENLESANDGETVFSIFQKDEVKETESKPIIDGVINPEPTQETLNENETNTTVVITYPNNETTQEGITNEEEVVSGNEVVETEEPVEKPQDNTENSQEEENRTFKFSDFTILF